MQPEHAVAVAGSVFLVIGGILMVQSVRRGRELCRLFAERLPELYAETGAPRPGYFDSLRRTAYFQFVMQKQFTELPDPHLAEEFSKLRRQEVRHLTFLIFGFTVLGAAFLWLNFFQAA